MALIKVKKVTIAETHTGVLKSLRQANYEQMAFEVEINGERMRDYCFPWQADASLVGRKVVLSYVKRRKSNKNYLNLHRMELAQ